MNYVTEKYKILCRKNIKYCVVKYEILCRKKTLTILQKNMKYGVLKYEILCIFCSKIKQPIKLYVYCKNSSILDTKWDATGE